MSPRLLVILALLPAVEQWTLQHLKCLQLSSRMSQEVWMLSCEKVMVRSKLQASKPAKHLLAL